jgi:amino acid transporter
MDWMQILGLIFGIMMLFVLWPAYKRVSKESPKAEKGDWQAAIIPLAAVALLVLLLMMSV